MSCAILEDRETGKCCLYCNTSEWTLGPMFEDREAAENFLEWACVRYTDPRSLRDQEMEDIHSEWLKGLRECIWCQTLIDQSDDDSKFCDEFCEKSHAKDIRKKLLYRIEI